MFAGHDTILEVDRVSKLFARRPKVTRARVGSVLARTMFGGGYRPISTLRPHEFWAVRDVGFMLKRGEALGIIGLNGSGKTTLLRMLAGQILPDAGEIRVLGKSAAMIDLTAGFQIGESGRANIFLRGAALGRNRAETAAAFENIVAFAELGDAIDAPVATYSTGMTMRLAFSIMIAETPDILLIDEILTVGDFRFRQKCLAKVREMRETAAFVLVTHSMQDVSRFCDRVIVMNKGQTVFDGEQDQAIEAYENLRLPDEPAQEKKIAALLAPVFVNDEVLKDVSHYWADEAGKPVSSIPPGGTVELRISFTSTRAIKELIVGVPMWTEDGTYVTGFSTEIAQDRFNIRAGECAGIRLKVNDLHFNPGSYVSNLTILDGPEFLYRQPNPPLTVTKGLRRWWGVVTLPHKWYRCEPSTGRDVSLTHPDQAAIR